MKEHDTGQLRRTICDRHRRRRSSRDGPCTSRGVHHTEGVDICRDGCCWYGQKGKVVNGVIRTVVVDVVRLLV